MIKELLLKVFVKSGLLAMLFSALAFSIPLTTLPDFAFAASPTIIMLAPAPNSSYSVPSGNVYLSSNYSLLVNVASGDVGPLQNQGAILLTPRNNVSATRTPLGTDDFTANYGIGSQWVDVAVGPPSIYVLTAMTTTPGSATWTQLAPGSSTPAAPISVSSGATLTNAFCNVLTSAAGGFFTLTLSASSGYPLGCVIEVIDADAGAGKTLSVSGLSSGGFPYTGCGVGNICPGQSVKYVATAAKWLVTHEPGPWRPTSSPTLFADPAGVNTNDCTTSTRPCTLTFLCIARSTISRSGSSTGMNVTIQVNDGTYTGGAGQSLCSIVGNGGADSSGLTFINGNNSTPTNVLLSGGSGGIVVFTKDLGETEISNLEIAQGASGSGLGVSGAQFSVVDMLSGITYGCMGSSGLVFNFSQSASLNIDGDYTIAAPCSYTAFYVLGSNANMVSASPGPIGTISGGLLSLTSFFINQGGYFNLTGMTFPFAGGGSIVAIKFSNYALGTSGTAPGGGIRSNGTPINTLAPGTVSQAMPISLANDSDPIGLFAQLPTCNSNTHGAQFIISDSTTVTWGATAAGSGGNVALVGCNGSVYTVVGK